MSIGIATMGKFNPAVGGTPVVVEKIVYMKGSSDGWETVRQKPQVVVSRLEDDSVKKEIIEVQVLSIEED